MNPSSPPPADEPPAADGGEHIELHVGSLELDGLVQAEPQRVEDAFCRELTRLLEQQGLPARMRELAGAAAFDAGALSRPDLGNAERLGSAVARLVYAELVR